MKLLAALLLAMAFTAPARIHTIDANDPSPAGLTADDWRQIRAEHERHRHTAFPDGKGFRARLREQQLYARFDGRGFEIRPDQGDWSFGLQLMDHGEARMKVDRNRVTYSWGSGLEEWFVNEARGLEHGFTMQQPGTLHLAVRGGLRAEGGGTVLRFGDVVNYSELKAWDADGRVLPAHMAADGGVVTISVDDRGARYPVTIDPIVQQAYLKPTAAGTTQAGDNFGFSVAASGDTVVVGALLEDSDSLGVNSTPSENASAAGAAYVFVRTAGVWSQQAYLKPAAVGTTQAGDNFGRSVAISGNTLVVGANTEDSASLGVNSVPDEGSDAAGAAYVFVRTAGVWIQQAYLKPSNVGTTQAGDNFGVMVGVSGDTVVVGAVQEDSASTGVNSTPDENADSPGAAYVFVRTAGVWSQQAYLKPGNVGTGQATDQFGLSVAVSGDTVVVGAPQEDSSTTGVNSAPNELSANAGAAYVFVRAAGVWSQQAFLKPASVGTTQAGDQFGLSVAVAGDTLVVGAAFEDSSSVGVNSTADEIANNAGAVFVYTRTAGVWSQQAYLKPAAAGTTQAGDNFGRSVAVAGETVMVGAALESSASLGVNGTPDENAASAGAAYVFLRVDGVWRQQAYLKPAAVGTTQAGDNLGRSVAVSDDTLVSGAALEDSTSLGINSTPDEGANNAGVAYAWLRSGPFITQVIDAGSLKPEITASSWVTIKGAGLASTTRIWVDADFVGGLLPTKLEGISVTIDGKPAAVYYISPVQLNVLAGAITHTGPVNVVVTTPQGTDTFTATVRDRTPSWFLLDPEDRKYVAAVNLDGSIVGKTGLYPAAPNATKPLPARGRALVFGNAWGLTNPVTPEGTVFSGAFPITGAGIKIGGVAVSVEFAGVVTPGLFQFNIVAPDLQPGDYLIEGSINGQTTQTGAYITLGPAK